MNRKYVVKNSDGELYSCVITPDQDETAQWETVFDIKKGYGFRIDLWKDRVDLVDYFHGETRASFPIVSVEDTEEPVTGRLIRI